MDIQKNAVRTLLRTIVSIEEELEAIRQLLNEEITFTLQSTFAFVSKDSAAINIFSLRRLLEGVDDQEGGLERGMERMMKFYSCGRLELSMKEWKTLLLSREDRLLGKLAQQRQSGQEQPPQYLLSYCRKVILKEAHLHLQFANLQHCSSNEEKFERTCKQALKEYTEDEIYLIKRYLMKGASHQVQFPFEVLKQIINPPNVREIVQFLERKQDQLIEKQNKKSHANSPFLHKEFKRLGANQDPSNFSLRQAKSIQNYVNRNNSPSSSRILQKIAAFTSQLEQQLSVFFKSLRKIMRLNAKIVSAKQQLITTNCINFSLIFKEISKNNQIVPSELQHYFRTLNIDVPLQSFYIIFKRNCDPITGKLSKKQFVNIFKLPSHPKPSKTSSITAAMRYKVTSCILNQIEQQSKIEKEKAKLLQLVDLRDIFQAIDVSNQRAISMTDLKVIYRKIDKKIFQQEQIRQFWWRMKARPDELVDYDTFMYEIIPRIKSKPTS